MDRKSVSRRQRRPAPAGGLGDALRQLGSGIERAVAAAGRDGNVRVARRTNIVVNANTGEPGSVSHAEAVQNAPIHQGGRASDA